MQVGPWGASIGSAMAVPRMAWASALLTRVQGFCGALAVPEPAASLPVGVAADVPEDPDPEDPAPDDAPDPEDGGADDREPDEPDPAAVDTVEPDPAPDDPDGLA